MSPEIAQCPGEEGGIWIEYPWQKVILNPGVSGSKILF